MSLYEQNRGDHCWSPAARVRRVQTISVASQTQYKARRDKRIEAHPWHTRHTCVSKRRLAAPRSDTQATEAAQSFERVSDARRRTQPEGRASRKYLEPEIFELHVHPRKRCREPCGQVRHGNGCEGWSRVGRPPSSVRRRSRIRQEIRITADAAHDEQPSTPNSWNMIASASELKRLGREGCPTSDAKRHLVSAQHWSLQSRELSNMIRRAT